MNKVLDSLVLEMNGSVDAMNIDMAAETQLSIGVTVRLDPLITFLLERAIRTSELRPPNL